MERKTADDLAQKLVAEFEANVTLFTGMRELIEAKLEQFSKNPNVRPAAIKDLSVAIKNV